jgi:uncharacterized membrane protein YdbT with pleckstrin-like domain
MAFPEDILDSDEHVVRSMRPHWRRIAGPIVLTPIVVFLVTYLALKLDGDGAQKYLRWLVLVAGLVVLVWWCLRPYLVWLTTRYVLTDRRVLMRSGVLSKSGRDVPLTRVNDVSFKASLIERLFRSGTLTIESAGERGQVLLNDVPRVEEVQREIYRLVEDEEQRLK